MPILEKVFGKERILQGGPWANWEKRAPPNQAVDHKGQKKGLKTLDELQLLDCSTENSIP